MLSFALLCENQDRQTSANIQSEGGNSLYANSHAFIPLELLRMSFVVSRYAVKKSAFITVCSKDYLDFLYTGWSFIF